MRFYELAYLVSSNVENPDSIYQKINQLIEQKGGKVDKVNPSDNVSLAHPIRKEDKAILASLTFYIEPDKLKGVKDELRSLSSSSNTKESNSPILRFLIIKREPIKKEVKTISTKPTKEKLLDKEEPKKISRKAKKVELTEVNQKIEEILKGQNES